MTSATVRGKLMVGSGGRVPRTTNRCAVSGTGVTPLVFDFPEPSVQSLAPMRQLVGGGASLESYSVGSLRRARILWISRPHLGRLTDVAGVHRSGRIREPRPDDNQQDEVRDKS